MGNSAANIEGLFGFGPKGNKARRERGAKIATANALESNAALTPPTLPSPPSALEDTIRSSAAMQAVVNRYRKQRGGGLSSTVKTGGAGDTSPVPGVRKTLLGQ